jgi:hypothetical protein
MLIMDSDVIFWPFTTKNKFYSSLIVGLLAFEGILATFIARNKVGKGA